MRICLLSARFPPQRCGVGDYTCFLATALARMGHDVDVLTSVGDFDYRLYPLPPNVHLHRVVTNWGSQGLPDMLRHLRRLDPQALLVQYAPHSFDRRGITLAVNLLPAVLRVVGRVRVITNFHEMYVPFSLSPMRSVSALWQRGAALLVASGSHALSVTCSEWQRCLHGLGIQKPAQLIPAGSNIPFAEISKDERVRVRRDLIGNEEQLLVAAFGAKHDRDIRGVFYGLQQLKKQTSARLVWIGGSTVNAELRVSLVDAMRQYGLGEGDVVWTGELPHPAASSLLSASDVMILPFIDGVSTRRTSVITAMQHGLPVLTTSGRGSGPWFVHGENVYLTPVGDRQSLAIGLIELARNPALRLRLGQGGRTLYDTYFSWDVIGRQIASQAEQEVGLRSGRSSVR